MSKISGYANSVAALGTDDLLDVSEKISSSPDVYESRKMTGAILAAFIQAYTNDSIYSASGTVPSSVIATITDFLRFSGGRLDLSTTTDGFLMPRLTTAQKNAIASPTTDLFLFDTDLNTIEWYDGTKWVSIVGNGVLGIANSEGVYTYYSSFSAAITAASAGDTIEMFGNITDTSTITVSKNLNINLNGYTYTNNSTGTEDAFYLTATDVNILNGKIVRSGGSYGASQNRGLLIGAAGNYDFSGLTVEVDSGICINGTTAGAEITNGVFKSTNLLASEFGVLYTGNISNATIETTGINRFSGTVRKCYVSTTIGYNYLLNSTAKAYNCVFEVTNTAGLDGLLIDGGKAYFCKIKSVSTGSSGLRVGGANAEAWYCEAETDGKHGIEIGTGSPKGIYYCTGVTNHASSYGGRITNIDEVKFCTFVSTAGSGGIWCSAADVLFESCIIKAENSASYIRGFYDSASTGTVRLYNCLIETAGASTGNDSILFTSGRSTYLAHNRIKGGLGINYGGGGGNLQTTAEDSVGNIILD